MLRFLAELAHIAATQGAEPGVEQETDQLRESVLVLARENAQLRWMAGFEPGQDLSGFGPEDPPRRYVMPTGGRTNSCHEAFAAWLDRAMNLEHEIEQRSGPYVPELPDSSTTPEDFPGSDYPP